jgi:hypothetical protein
MPSPDRSSLIAAAALLLAACSHKDDKTRALNDSVAANSSLAGDPRKASGDSAAPRKAAESAAVPRPDSAPRAAKPVAKPVAKPGARMAPGERTDKTPSIPVNPPVMKPD